MNCSQVRQRLAEFVYADLAPPEAWEVEAHLRSCPECRKDKTALAGVRSLLDCGGTVSVPADLPAIYRRAAEMQKRRASIWRRSSIAALGAAAAVLIVAMVLRLEIHADARQVVIRWGTLAERQALSPLEADPALARSRLPELQSELAVLSELVQGLTEEQDARERRIAVDRASFRAELDELRRQAILHWMATERDVGALYGTQLTSTQKGGLP
jgi:Putative zinc-finger